MKSQGKWEATISQVNGQSFVSKNAHRVPINGLDFEGDHGEVLVYLMGTCPGIFNGDSQTISATVEEEAHLLLTDSSPTELHPSGTSEAMYQTITFQLERESILEYLPEPLIPFKGSHYKGATTLHLSTGAQAFVSEIVACGRVGRNEFYEYLGLETRFEVFWDGELRVSDIVRLDPKKQLTRQAILDDFTHYGSIWLLSEKVTQKDLSYIREHLLSEGEEEKVYAGASRLDQFGMVVRLLGFSSEALQRVIQKVWDYYRIACLGLAPMEVLR